MGRRVKRFVFFSSCAVVFIVQALLYNSNQSNAIADWDIDNLSVNQIFDYFLWTNSTSCKLTNFFGGFMSGSGTEVGLDGQKGVCLDKQVAPDPRNCLVYSFGINRDWSFDDTIATYGCQVFAFDPSIKATNHTRSTFVGNDERSYNYTIEFFEMGLDAGNYEGFQNKPHVPMRTLSTIYNSLKERHGDVIIDHLKIDIDDAEWRVLPEILASGMMAKVRQLAIEIHLMPSDSIDEIRRKAHVIRRLENYGMIRFASLYNQFSYANFAGFGFRRPSAFDIAFYNSNLMRIKGLL